MKIDCIFGYQYNLLLKRFVFQDRLNTFLNRRTNFYLLLSFIFEINFECFDIFLKVNIIWNKTYVCCVLETVSPCWSRDACYITWFLMLSAFHFVKYVF